MMKKTLMTLAVAAAFGSTMAYATNPNTPNTPPGCGPSGNTPQKCDGDNTSTSNGGSSTSTSSANGGTSQANGNNTGGTGTGVGVGLGYGAGGSATGGAATGGNASSNGTNLSNNANSAEGGKGGAGGNATGGSSSSSGINGQQQGISGSGNSDSKNTNSVASANSVKGGDQAVNSANSVKGGDQAVKGTNTSSQNASTRSGSDNAIGIDASDRSSQSYTDNSKVIFIPPVVPPTPPSTLAVGNIVKETTACGPLMSVTKTPVIGKFFGLVGTDDVPQGFTYDLTPVLDANNNVVTYSEIPLADGSGYRMIGTQAIIFATIVGTSNARNLALGGGGSQGNWGQGGTGTSASNQQLVTNIQLKACDVGTVKFTGRAAPTVAALPVIQKAQQ